MATKGPKREAQAIRKNIALAFSPDQWDRLETEAQSNRRAINHEIAVRVLDSIQEERV